MDRLDPNGPAALGFRQPAEREPHRATWLAWPHREGDWPGKLQAIEWVYGETVRKLSRREVVTLLVPDELIERRAHHLLTQAGAEMSRVELVRVPTDRAWLRDTVPSFVRAAGEVALVDWRFTGWGKYTDFERDDAVGAHVARLRGMRRFVPMARAERASEPARVVLEGGSIDVDGEGTMLTTEECLLGEVQARNPGLSRDELERTFARELGITKVLWLGRGIAGDDTHGHVDDVARFVRPGLVVLAQEPDAADENHAPLAENRERLGAMRDAAGRAIEVVSLPMPAPLFFDGVRLPASYANFYVANGLVLVPTFNDPKDRAALGLLSELFPDREVVGVHAVDLVWGFGTLHCMAHDEPA